LIITPVFYYVIPTSIVITSIVIVIMYHLVPTPESFEIIINTNTRIENTWLRSTEKHN
jgi:hypothetical protein